MGAKAKRKAVIAALIAAAVAAACAAALGWGAWQAQKFRKSSVIARNVSIEGIDVGGMSAAEARAALMGWLEALPGKVQLVADGEAWEVEPERLGVRVLLDEAISEALKVGREGGLWQTFVAQLRLRRQGVNIRVRAAVDKDRLRRAIQELAGEINRPPKDAQVTIEQGQVRVQPEQDGLEVDVEASVEKLAEALQNPHVRRAELVVRRQPAKLRAADLAEFDCVLSEFSTPFNPGQRSRTHNLKLGASLINETLIKPGEVFSLNKALGPRVIARGFKPAPTFVGRKTIDTPGGGVCQIATTVYNAALLAGLEIVERYHHSRPVHYCPAGRDATVVYGGADLKFRNSLRHPIMLLAGTRGNRLWVALVGNHEDKVQVELVRTGIKWLDYDVKEVPDPSLQPGQRVVEEKGRRGVKVTLIRIIRYPDGTTKRQVMHTDVYKPQPEIVRVGPELAPGLEAGEPTKGAQGGSAQAPAAGGTSGR